MEEEKPPIANTSANKSYIKSGRTLLLKLPNGLVKTVEHYLVKPGKTINLGKYGSFYMDDLLGKPYGITYEIVNEQAKTSTPTSEETQEQEEEVVEQQQRKRSNKKQKVDRLPGKLVPIINQPAAEQVDESEIATNELIKSTGAQTLSNEEIAELKAAGLSGRDIIEAQINSHSAFDLKSEYSKRKYRQKKEQKYLCCFTPLAPTIYNITDYYFTTNPSKTLDMRTDTLSQMLTLANVSPGSRVLVVDSTSGLLTGAVLERLGGIGSCLHIHEHTNDPILPILNEFGLPQDISQPLSYLNWALLDKDWEPAQLPTEPKDGQYKNSNEMQRYKKRKETFDIISKARQNFWAGEWDTLLVASNFQFDGVIDRLKNSLTGSGQVVVYHPIQEVMVDVYRKLRADSCFLNTTITSSNLRAYQVLPGRTHPEMSGSMGPGYLVNAIRVFDKTA